MNPAAPPDEAAALRRCIRDLAALAALPAVWSGSDALRIVESLADALLGMLDLDFIYIHTRARDGSTGYEAARLAAATRAFDAAALGAALAPWLADGAPSDRTPPLPGCAAGTRAVRVPFSSNGSAGFLVAGRRAASFPAESDRLLLRVAGNQAAVLLARQRAEAEREQLLRAVQTERERLADIFQRAPSFMAVLSGPDHVVERVNDSYLRLVGGRDVLGKPVGEALPGIAQQGFIDLLDRVYRSGEAYVGKDQRVVLEAQPGATDPSPRELFLDFVYQALRNADGSIGGVLVQGVDLTERKRAEAELRAKDEWLNLLFDNLRDYAIVITDTAGTILEWHGGAERLTGYAAAQAVGRRVDALFARQAAAEAPPDSASAVPPDRAWYLRKDGTRYCAEGSTSPLFDAEGRLRGHGRLFRDATAQQRAAEQLASLTAESQRRRRLYETILSNTPDLAYVFDLDHRFTYANEVLLRMWGRTWDEAIGKTCWELGYEPWHAAMHDREIEQVKATCRPVRGEVPFTGTFGRRIYDYIFVPVRGPGGEVEAIAGTTRDITERKRSEEETARLLAQEQHRARLLGRVAQASRSLHAVLSVDDIARTLSEQARDIVGAHAAATSLTCSDNRSPPGTAISLSDEYAREHGDDAGLAGSLLCAEVCRLNVAMRLTHEELRCHPLWRADGGRDGRCPPRRGWLAAPLIGHGGRNLGVVQLVDKADGEFSEQDEAVLVQLAAIAAIGIENARLYDSLREQDRRKDEFLATLAHELRNPLAPVRSGLQILRLSGGLDAAAAHTRDVMERQLTHLVRLVDDLMDVSRVSRGQVTLELAPVALQTVCELALETSRPLIEASQHTLEVDLPEPRLVLRADLTRIAQVLSNLLNNAAKYTPAGGRIGLRGRQVGAEVEIEVSDNGLGIPEDMLDKVFDLFAQLHHGTARAQGGLGIGLSLARRLAEMHGGSLTAHSGGAGRGSTFILRLPLAAAEAPAQRPSDPAIACAPRRRVLVVDDNADAAESLSLLLGLLGHETRVARSGTEAIAAAIEFRPEVMFLDIGLPGIDGYEVARRLRAEPGLDAVTMVAVTGWGSDEDRRRALAAGFDVHLTKPVDAATVASLVARMPAAPQWPPTERRVTAAGSAASTPG